MLSSQPMMRRARLRLKHKVRGKRVKRAGRRGKCLSAYLGGGEPMVTQKVVAHLRPHQAAFRGATSRSILRLTVRLATSRS